jgi:hypothetical protein
MLEKTNKYVTNGTCDSLYKTSDGVLLKKQAGKMNREYIDVVI